MVDLAGVHEVLKHGQHGAQLLMLLLDAQLLVHAVHSLFKAGLEGRDLIPHLLPLLLSGVSVNQDKFKLIDSSSCFVAVLCEVKDFTTALDASSLLHLLRHVVCYAAEGAGFILSHILEPFAWDS